MACFVATLGVIIGSGLINLSAANKDSCELYAAVGQDLTLPFLYKGSNKSYVLKWTHNSTVLFYGQPGRVSVGKPVDVTATGSLLLKNLQHSSAGAYQATWLHPNGKPAETWSGRLCLMDKVSKPRLSYHCDFKSSAVTLNCLVTHPRGMVFSWALDERTLAAETRQHLSVPLAQLKGGRTFTCSVANRVSKEKSDSVRPTCESPPPTALLCFASHTVLAVVAGGASLILLLLTAVVILCCRHGCNKTPSRVTDNGQLRMLSMTKREPKSVSPDYETMHPAEDAPPLHPQPSPRSCYENVCRPEAQTEPRLQEPSTAAEGRQPSPVPKPRTKGLHAPNI